MKEKGGLDLPPQLRYHPSGKLTPVSLWIRHDLPSNEYTAERRTSRLPISVDLGHAKLSCRRPSSRSTRTYIHGETGRRRSSLIDPQFAVITELHFSTLEVCSSIVEAGGVRQRPGELEIVRLPHS
jgi:hypothetical protein